jgi:hypothetical protein
MPDNEWPSGWAIGFIGNIPKQDELRVMTPLERHMITADDARKLAKWLLWAADMLAARERKEGANG